MEVVLKKMGNSTALIVPPPVPKDLGMQVGQHLRLDTSPDGKIVLTPKHKHSLRDLLAQCNAKAAPPADLEPWNNARTVGQEAW